MKFNGQKLKTLIELKAESNNIKKMTVRKKIIETLGITRQSLGNWEHGLHMPSYDHIFWLIEFFGVGSISDLILNNFKEVKNGKKEKANIWN